MSNQLECNATTCVYNYNQLCGANSIKVQGGGTTSGDATYCGTFEERGVGSFISSLAHTNYVGAIGEATGAGTSLNPDIYCSARHCSYNDHEKCHASQIHILGHNSSTAEMTECETFYPQG